MPPVTIHADHTHIKAAARILGLDEHMPAGQLGREIIRHIASSPGGYDAMRRRITSGGNAPKEAGRKWELEVVQYFQETLPEWDKAPLKGVRDQLDVSGTLPDGYLIGCKTSERGVSPAEKLNEAMLQCERAMQVTADRGVPVDDIFPYQILRRQGYTTGDSYAFTMTKYLRVQVEERRRWRRLAQLAKKRK